MNPVSLFHPAVADWFDRSFAAPTAAQAQAWPAFQAGRHVLIAAPTGSGKTLAAFLAAIDALVRQALAHGLKDETQIVYVSPLKALSNDIRCNLEAPLAGIRAALQARGLPDVDIRTWVRTGDTPAGERDRMRRRPPHIVVTTPESLYILLGSESGRAMLATTRTVIVDEIHALAPNKRGTHLAVSLERLAALCGNRLQRVGLSATQKPIEEVARFLVGAASDSGAGADCTIVDTGHRRARDLALEVPDAPLEAVMSAEVWEQVYAASRAPDRGASHHADLRQYPQDGGAGDAPAVGPDRPRARGRTPRQPGQGAAPRRRAAAQARQAQGAGGDRLARARHRHRRGRPGLPARLAALDLGVPAAGRAIRTRGRGHAQGPAVPALARRAGGMRGAHRQRRPRRARPARHSAAAARRAGAADRGRGGDAGMERGRAVRADPLRVALSRAGARGFRGGGRHAGGRLQHAPWPPRRAHPPRRRQSHAARAARGASHRPDLGRDDPGQRRLSSPAGAGEPRRRQRERGLRGREPRRRHLPARQQELSHHARGARRGAGRGCPWHGADHSVLAGRGARPQRRALGRGVAAARGHGGAPAQRPERK